MLVTYLAPLPAPLLRPLPLPGPPELVPVLPLSDPVFPPDPVSFSIPGLVWPGVPCFLCSFGVPLSALPVSPAAPPPLPPGEGGLCATSMEAEIGLPGALLAADA
jgi:hypothetical protein